MKENQFLKSLSDGINTVKICSGTACGSKAKKWIEDKYDGEIFILNTDQGAERIIVVEAVPCLKACGLAPVIQINGRLHGKVDWQEMLESFRAQAKEQR